MPTDIQRKSEFYVSFKDSIDGLRGYSSDSLLNRLFFSHVISVMEKYLYDIFIHEISEDSTKLKRLANQNKFKEQKIGVAFALNNSVANWIIDTIKKMVWHRLNDIQILYKDVLGIRFELERSVIDAINKRHDLVHRNGFDTDGNAVSVSEEELSNLISTIDQFISRIDDEYISS